jgi:hypothetical protein
LQTHPFTAPIFASTCESRNSKSNLIDGDTRLWTIA